MQFIVLRVISDEYINMKVKETRSTLRRAVWAKSTVMSFQVVE